MLETPRQLLERLRKAAGDSPVLADALSEEEAVEMLIAVGFPLEEARLRARELRGTANLSEGMLDDTLSRAPQWFQDAMVDEDRLAAGALFTNELNAEALRAANGGWLLLVNQGLMLFVYKIARVVACQLEPRDDDKPQVSEELAYTELKQIFESVALHGVPVGGDVPLSRNQFRMATSLAVAAEHFVLCHELGHHVLKHLDSGSIAHLTLRATPVALARMDWRREFEADAFGLGFLVPLDANDNRSITFENRQAFAGIHFLLRVIDLYEDLMARLAERGVAAAQAPRDTHPPPGKRFEAVAQAALSALSGDMAACADLAGTSDAVEATLIRILRQGVSRGSTTRIV